MAARRKRRWIAIGGLTAAVAVGLWAAVASATPSGLVVAPATTKLAPHLTWTDDDGTVTGFDVQRQNGCTGAFGTVGSTPDATPVFDDSTLPLNGTADGTYCYHVVAHYPAAPDATSNTASVLLDTTDPDVHITNPVAGSVKGLVQIQATATDAGSGLASLAVSVVGNASFGVSTTSPATGVWDTKALGVPDGAYTVRAVATDRLGHQTTVDTAVNLDNTGPAAPSITFLQNVVTGSPTLLWSPAPESGETYHVARTGPTSKAFTDPVTSNWTDPDTLPPGQYSYVVTATDAVGNSTPSAAASVIVVPPSVTAPRSISADSPTNTVPHLSWQPPVTFAVTSWEIFRDGTLLKTVPDASATSFDDTSLASQGAHSYSVQAFSGSTPGDMSSAVTVTYDTVPPVLAPVTATPGQNGSIAINWPDASDPAPGSGVASYIVRRGSSAPADSSSGTAICTLTPPVNSCLDSTAKSGNSYGYAVFAIDGAGNFVRREASAKSLDTQPPDPVSNLKLLSFDFSYARLGWDAPVLKGADADIAGYRVLKLRKGAKAPLDPSDGTIVCTVTILTTPKCDALNLIKGQKVTFAVYAYDEVPNYSAPVMLSMTPHSIDHTPPHKPTKVKLTHAGLNYSLSWVSPLDADLSKFRVTLYDKKPPSRPSLGKAVVTGRVLHATFSLKAGQKVYVTLWALDVSGNFSRVTKLVVAPGKVETRSKHKAAKEKTAVSKKTVAKKKKKKKTPAKVKPVPVSIT